MNATFPADAGRVLLAIARQAIEAQLGLEEAPALSGDVAPWLCAPGASFVTLTASGRLRGCIGSLHAHRPLAEDVAANARAAAFDDPRFPPLSAAEASGVRVEVSVLSESEPFPVADAADAAARLRPGIDGVILTAGRRRGTFLPQVWDDLPDPHDFLAHLVRKAGLPASYWGPDVRLERYTVTKWRE